MKKKSKKCYLQNLLLDMNVNKIDQSRKSTKFTQKNGQKLLHNLLVIWIDQ